MRGTYEAYILVKVKDGREFVCALNRKKNIKDAEQQDKRDGQFFLESQVIWN